MAEYIERETAVKAVLRERKPENSVAQNRKLSIIQRELVTIPAADVAPVVHGEWVLFRRSITGAYSLYYCSACRAGGMVKSNYCPDCGAKMDGGAD